MPSSASPSSYKTDSELSTVHLKQRNNQNITCKSIINSKTPTHTHDAFKIMSISDISDSVDAQKMNSTL